MTDVHSVLQTAFAECGPYLGVHIETLCGVPVPTDTPPCFFLEREKDFVDTLKDLGGCPHAIKTSAKKFKVFSHVKLYKGRYLDYINYAEYNSLEEWASDNQSSIDNILFGYQKFDGENTYIHLKQLIQHLSPPPELAEIEEMMEGLEVAPKRRLIAKCGSYELSYQE